GAPAVQTSSVHWSPSTGRSPLLATLTMLPRPSHWFCWQSPGVCMLVTVPAAVLLTPQVLPLQVRTWHSVSEPGHWAAVRHWTHTPPAHAPLWQSPLPRHIWPSAHLVAHDPPQSTSVSLPFLIPSAQPAATHMPMPLHSVPPPWLHIAPRGLFGCDGTPIEHTSSVHSLPSSTGRSAFWLTLTTPPAPLHWFSLQSPVVWLEVGVPLGVKETPHAFRLQVRAWQS